MDDLKARTSQWCEQAHRVCETPGNTGTASLPSRLDAIAGGMRLRRQLDRVGPDQPLESSRRDLVRQLIELQVLAEGETVALVQGTSCYKEVAERVKDWLTESRASLRNVLSELRLGPLQQAMVMEGLRTDLEWLSALVSRLDGETASTVTAWLDVELGVCAAGWRAPAGRDPDPRDLPLLAGCERMQAVVLERRIRRELDRPAAGLERPRAVDASVSTLATAGASADSEPRLPQGSFALPARWRPRPAARRAVGAPRLLAELADDWLTALPLARRAPACGPVVQTAVDEVGETIAFLEDSVLRGVVTRLKLVRDDLERLVVSCRRWERPALARRGDSHDHSDRASFGPGSDPLATNIQTDGNASSPTELSAPIGARSGRLETEPPGRDGRGSDAAKLLHRGTRRVERRRARCAVFGKRSSWPSGWSRSSAPGLSWSWKTWCWS